MNILTRILKILAYVGTILVVLLLLLFLFTQTQFFKDRIRILLIATLSHETNGTVHIGTIKGNFFNELSVDSLGISYNNQRSEERRVGKECTSWCRSRWWPYH